jgi:hypothetical protein
MTTTTKVELRKNIGFLASREVLGELAKESVLSGKQRYLLILEAVRDLDLSKLGEVVMFREEYSKKSVPLPKDMHAEILALADKNSFFSISTIVTAALESKYGGR